MIDDQPEITSTGGRHPRRRSGIVAVLSAAMLAATGLLVGAATSSAASPHRASAAISRSTLASLKKIIANAEKVPTWKAPGPAVKARAVRGTSAIVFPINSEIDACQTQAEDFQALGKKLGMHVHLFSNSGQPTQWVSGAEDAVSQHDKALVMLCGIIPGAVAPQLAAAHSHHIVVVDGNYNETNDYAGLDGETAVNTIQGMKDDVDEALINLKGKPLHVLFLTSDSVIQGPAATTAVSAEVKRVCARTCSVVENIDVPIQNWATSIESDVSSALVAHPNVNAVIVAFDGMCQFAIPGIESSHRSNLKIYTWGGSRSIEKLMLKKGSIIAGDSGPDERWDAYDAMDQVIRLEGHHRAASVFKEADPNRYWVPSNVKQFFGPGGTYGDKGFGGPAFINDFRHLWGLR